MESAVDGVSFPEFDDLVKGDEHFHNWLSATTYVQENEHMFKDIILLYLQISQIKYLLHDEI